MRLLAASAALIGLLAFVACSDEEGEDTTVDVTLTEFSVEVDPASALRGDVTFDLENEGEEDHEFRVLRTDFAPDELPTDDDGRADTGAAGVDEVGVREAFDGSSSGTWSLDPGAYVLICNLRNEVDGEEISHYSAGMYTAFSVEEIAEE